jgi:hypothetical protein
MSASGCECKRRRSRIGEQLGRVPSNTATMTSCSLRRLQELADGGTMSASGCSLRRLQELADGGTMSGVRL